MLTTKRQARKPLEIPSRETPPKARRSSFEKKSEPPWNRTVGSGLIGAIASKLRSRPADQGAVHVGMRSSNRNIDHGDCRNRRRASCAVLVVSGHTPVLVPSGQIRCRPPEQADGAEAPRRCFVLDPQGHGSLPDSCWSPLLRGPGEYVGSTTREPAAKLRV
jgi:hypothetical protein